jgi:hypothetical protein
MTSDRKVAANRRNAQKSTGPRTLSGKATASMNALKHGLCSRKPLIPGENEAEFTAFTNDWVDHLKPAGPHQSLLAEQIIMSSWQLKRVPQLEAGLFARYMRTDGEHPFAMDPEAYQQLSRIDRHQVTLQRTLDRAMKELRELQEEEAADDADFAEQQNEPIEKQVPVEVLVTQPAAAPSQGPEHRH